MMLVALLWLMCPVVLMHVVSQHPAALRVLVRMYPAGVVIGAVGAAAMVLGALVVHGPLGLVLYFVGAPLCGLVVFSRGPHRDDGDDGGGGGGGGGDDHPEGGEDGPPFDWPEFERAFWAHVTRTPQPVARR